MAILQGNKRVSKRRKHRNFRDNHKLTITHKFIHRGFDYRNELLDIEFLEAANNLLFHKLIWIPSAFKSSFSIWEIRKKNPGRYVCLLEGTIVGGELVALEPSLSSGIFPGKKTDGPDGILFSKYLDSL